jgi:hypothetical protein
MQMRGGNEPDDYSTEDAHTFISFEKLKVSATSIRQRESGGVRFCAIEMGGCPVKAPLI